MVLPLSCLVSGGGEDTQPRLGRGEWAGGRCGGFSLAAQSQVLMTAAHRERSGAGGAAEGVPQPTAGADQPPASAQVSGQAGPRPQVLSLPPCLPSLSPLLSPRFPFTTSRGLLGLLRPGDPPACVLYRLPPGPPSMPHVCPHRHHLHTVQGLASLSGPSCSRCSQKWPEVLLSPEAAAATTPTPRLLPNPARTPKTGAKAGRQGEITILSVGR